MLTAISNGRTYPKENFGSGTTTLIVSNEEIDDISKIAKFLEDSGLLIIKGASETIKNEAKKQKSDLLPCYKAH